MEVKIYSNIWKQYLLLSVGLIFSLPITAYAFWGVNSLDEKNDLNFRPGLEAAFSSINPNTTYERAQYVFEVKPTKTLEQVMGLDRDGNVALITEVVARTERIKKPIDYTNLKSPAVVLLHSCSELNQGSLPDLNRWKNSFTSHGYAVLVIDSVGTRDIKPYSNCWGIKRPIGKDRLVKDLFDAVAHLSSMPEIDSSRIFALGFSLGAMTAGISGSMADDRGYASKPHPRAVAGLYGGCRYRSENWLESKSSFPILWLMGSADQESPATDCMSSVKDLENQGIGSEWHTYENATHCWDCKALDGLTRTAGNGSKVTYLYDEGATQDSEQRVLKFFEKFQTTRKQD